MSFIYYFPIIVSVFGIVFAWFLASRNKKIPADVAELTIKESIPGAKKQFVVSGITGLVIFVLFLFLGWQIAVGFMFGVIVSGLLVLVVSRLQRNSNTGLIEGFLIAAFGLLAISIFYFFAKDIQGLFGFAFGLSLISVFSKVLERNFGAGAGKVADIFETYCIILIATIIFGVILFQPASQFVFLPLILASVSILISIVSIFFAKYGEKKVIVIASVLSVTGFYFIILRLMAQVAISVDSLYFSGLAGLAVSLGIFFLVKYPKFKNYVTVVLAVLGAGVGFWLAGFYGMVLAGLGSFSIFPLIIGASQLPAEDASEKKDTLKAYGTSATIFAFLALFSIFYEMLRAMSVSVFTAADPKFYAGLIIGGLALYFLSSVKKPAGKIKEILTPVLIMVLSPILVGFILGPEALAGLLIGSIIVGLFISISTATSAMSPLIKGLCIVSLLIIGFLV